MSNKILVIFAIIMFTLLLLYFLFGKNKKSVYANIFGSLVCVLTPPTAAVTLWINGYKEVFKAAPKTVFFILGTISLFTIAMLVIALIINKIDKLDIKEEDENIVHGVLFTAMVSLSVISMLVVSAGYNELDRINKALEENRAKYEHVDKKITNYK